MNRIGPNSAPEVSSSMQYPTLADEIPINSTRHRLWNSALEVSLSPSSHTLWDFKVKPREYKACSSTEVDELSKEYDDLYRKMKFLEIMDVMTNMDIKAAFQAHTDSILDVIDRHKSLLERSVTMGDRSRCSLWCF